MDISQSKIVSFIWSIADDCLRDVFLRGQYRDVILPMVVLRRFDALLEPTKKAVLDEVDNEHSCGFVDKDLDADTLKDVAGVPFYNISKWTLSALKSNFAGNEDALCENFEEYLNGFDKEVRNVIEKFGLHEKAKRLAGAKRLGSVLEKILDPYLNLTDREMTDPDGLPLPAVSNIAMGTIFEELLRKFNEENNEESGAHFTPRDAVSLLARLVFEPVKVLPKTISLYDPACGSGGMLTESFKYLTEEKGVNENAITLAGTEINPETYAICKADLIIKGVATEDIKLGNTITQDNFTGKTFGYCITNPPYGKSWKTDKDEIYHDGELNDNRFRLKLKNFLGREEDVDCTPRTSDGQLLFILEEINKMKPIANQLQGSRIASIHNGSSLFTGDAGQGESNIRRYLIEHDLVDAIIQLPNNIFYNTGIATYVWLLTNKKEDSRKGRVQLIDASQAFEKLRKNQGNRNCTITSAYAEQIVQCYMACRDQVATPDCPIESKVFNGDDFRYYAVTIERPLRLRAQFSALKVDELLFDAKEEELSHYLYNTYGEVLFEGLDDRVTEFRNYLNEQEIKKTDKQITALVASKAWTERRDLKQAAQTLMNAVGTDVFMDYNEFYDRVVKAARAAKLKLTGAQLKSICRTMAEIAPEAKPVISKVLKADAKEIAELTNDYGIPSDQLADYGIFVHGDHFVQYEPDSNLRDSEKIPVCEQIYDYFMREVRPYVADAWIEIPQTRIGCEISFNKYFYKPTPLRTLAENEADIRALDAQSQGFIEAILGEKTY